MAKDVKNLKVHCKIDGEDKWLKPIMINRDPREITGTGGARPFYYIDDANVTASGQSFGTIPVYATDTAQIFAGYNQTDAETIQVKTDTVRPDILFWSQYEGNTKTVKILGTGTHEESGQDVKNYYTIAWLKYDNGVENALYTPSITASGAIGVWGTTSAYPSPRDINPENNRFFEYYLNINGTPKFQSGHFRVTQTATSGVYPEAGTYLDVKMIYGTDARYPKYWGNETFGGLGRAMASSTKATAFFILAYYNEVLDNFVIVPILTNSIALEDISKFITGVTTDGWFSHTRGSQTGAYYKYIFDDKEVSINLGLNTYSTIISDPEMSYETTWDEGTDTDNKGGEVTYEDADQLETDKTALIEEVKYVEDITEADPVHAKIFMPYWMNSSHYKDFSKTLWDDARGDNSNWQKIKENICTGTQDPTSMILKFIRLPISNATMEDKEGKLNAYVSAGSYQLEYHDEDGEAHYCGAYINTHRYIRKSSTIELKELKGIPTYANYNGTDISIFLPYVGEAKLEASEVVGSTLQLTTTVDTYTGDVNYTLRVFRAEAYNQAYLDAILYRWSGNCAVAVPYTRGSAIEYVAGMSSNILTAGENAVGGLLDTLNAATAKKSIGKTLKEVGGNLSGSGAALDDLARTGLQSASTQHVRAQRGGAIDGRAGWMDVQNPYLIISYPQVQWPQKYAEIQGHLFCNTMILKDAIEAGCKYIKCGALHLDTVIATEEEKDEIERVLMNGIVI